jgi:hypothetical protein
MIKSKSKKKAGRKDNTLLNLELLSKNNTYSGVCTQSSPVFSSMENIIFIF